MLGLLSNSARRMSTRPVNKVVKSAKEAIADIQSGQTLIVGGFGLSGIPESLISELAEKPISGLTVVSNNAGVDGYGLGLLLAKNQVKRMIASYVGENKLFEELYLTGKLEVELTPQGNLAERCRAGGAGIPAFFTRVGAGTVLSSGEFPIKLSSEGKPLLFSEKRETKVIEGQEYVFLFWSHTRYIFSS